MKILARSKTLPTGPSNQLVATSTLELAGITEIRWILICCDSDTDAHNYLDKVITLDWDGEIARRKIALSSQLQIITGNADRDFSLAFSQKQARLLFNQLILQTENSRPSDLPINHFQALPGTCPPANLQSGMSTQDNFPRKFRKGAVLSTGSRASLASPAGWNQPGVVK